MGHRDQDQRGGEHRADPEAPGHVHQLGVLVALLGAVIVRGSSAIPQIGQFPGPSLHDLRVHRAGVLDRIGTGRRRFIRGGAASEMNRAGSALNRSRQETLQK